MLLTCRRELSNQMVERVQFTAVESGSVNLARMIVDRVGRR